MRQILDIASLEKNFLNKVFDLTAIIGNDWPNVEQIGAGKTICLLFWEPSTRTKLSFEHAAKKLGFNDNAALYPMVTMNVIAFLIMLLIFPLLFHICDFLGKSLVCCN